MTLHEDEHPFYGVNILRNREQTIINQLLAKYKDHKVDEALQKQIWDELQKAKHEGLIKIPFKVVLRRDLNGNFPPYIEIILDTKV